MHRRLSPTYRRLRRGSERLASQGLPGQLFENAAVQLETSRTRESAFERAGD